jgi:hypothetical protein
VAEPLLHSGTLLQKIIHVLVDLLGGRESSIEGDSFDNIKEEGSTDEAS